ncbi:MAG: type II toxin-antitoxin system VapC family toxin [Acidimicrobiaceae bacterium]|nr:type II toxin-antitoxin system VapC family toxin [Acidimicrobiia bacterium]MCY4493530.1 type II toxin-antitoxin system VapC family toxin [Acidimicrobiaceae bacterium]
MALSRALADTSLFIARETARPVLEDLIPDQLAVSVVTIGELRAGVLAANDTATRQRRLSTLTSALTLEPVPIDEQVATTCAGLRLMLRDRRLKMGVNDSWIAATAMTLGVAIVTQDQDFPSVEELEVISV